MELHGGSVKDAYLCRGAREQKGSSYSAWVIDIAATSIHLEDPFGELPVRRSPPDLSFIHFS
eukprot:scaffold230152_cov22-Tisochrysis_lutea.AAC.1